MLSKDIKRMRMDVGKFLYDYFIRFGEEKYETFVDKLGNVMEKEYGEPFSGENLRIMEAEFVTFSSSINEKKKTK